MRKQTSNSVAESRNKVIFADVLLATFLEFAVIMQKRNCNRPVCEAKFNRKTARGIDSAQ